MILFAIVLLLLAVLPDLYIWFSFVHSDVSVWWSAAYWIPSALALGTFAAAASGYYSDWTTKLFTALLLCIIVPKLLFVLVSLLGRAVGIFAGGAANIADITGGVLATAVAIAFLYGFVAGWNRLEVEHTVLSFDTLPASFDSYRLVQISDLHTGTFGNDTTFIKKLTDSVNAQNPDLVVFTGDIVNNSADELRPFAEILSRIKATDGVLSILGNHDYCEYGHGHGEAMRNLEELKMLEAGMGWRLLLNEHATVCRHGDSIAVIGVENDGRPPFPSRGDLNGAMRGIPQNTFKILLSHDPTHWCREVLPRTDIALTLSGHTHAMQLKIGRFSPSAFVYPQWGGVYRDNGRVLHVSTGAGGTVPFRFGAWPVINVITLKRKTV